METEKQFYGRLVKSFAVPAIMVALLWAVKLLEISTDSDFGTYGVRPLSFEGLRGIIFMPFLHGSQEHLISNSLPLLILGGFLFFFYREVAWKVLFWVYLMGGLWIWVGARSMTTHIGASGVVYGLAAFLFFSGIIRRHMPLMAISMLVVFLYGGIIWYIFPIEQGISWEGHLYGGLAGAVCAWYFRDRGTQRRKYSWDIEEEGGESIEVEYEEVLPNSNHDNPNDLKITYTFLPNPKNGRKQKE